MKRYRGVLFVEQTALQGNEGIWDAWLEGENLRLVWCGGRESTVVLRSLLGKVEHALPEPSLAFVSDDVVGLLFESSTPSAGLKFVEPHSLVHPIAWLS